MVLWKYRCIGWEQLLISFCLGPYQDCIYAVICIPRWWSGLPAKLSERQLIHLQSCRGLWSSSTQNAHQRTHGILPGIHAIAEPFYSLFRRFHDSMISHLKDIGATDIDHLVLSYIWLGNIGGNVLMYLYTMLLLHTRNIFKAGRI